MTTMSSPVGVTATAVAPGAFDVLDACHRQTVAMLARLSDLVSGLDQGDPDREAREAAEEIIEFFSQTARQHHEDEERHVFPRLLGSDDPETVQAVLRLQQDHHWMDVDWRSSRLRSPRSPPARAATTSRRCAKASRSSWR